MFVGALGFVFADEGEDVFVGVDFVYDVAEVVVGGIGDVKAGNGALFAVGDQVADVFVGEHRPSDACQVRLIILAVDVIAVVGGAGYVDEFVDDGREVFDRPAVILLVGVVGEYFVILGTGLVELVERGGFCAQAG